MKGGCGEGHCFVHGLNFGGQGGGGDSVGITVMDGQNMAIMWRDDMSRASWKDDGEEQKSAWKHLGWLKQRVKVQLVYRI